MSGLFYVTGFCFWITLALIIVVCVCLRIYFRWDFISNGLRVRYFYHIRRETVQTPFLRYLWANPFMSRDLRKYWVRYRLRNIRKAAKRG